MEFTAVDTNVVIAGLLEWHADHERALAVLLESQESDSGMILPLPVLLEAYAVLTRLPPPHRLAPESAHELLQLGLRQRSSVSSLPTLESWAFVRNAYKLGVAGGSIHDAHILACAKAAGARRFATFNHKHFSRLDLTGIELIIP